MKFTLPITLISILQTSALAENIRHRQQRRQAQAAHATKQHNVAHHKVAHHKVAHTTTVVVSTTPASITWDVAIADTTGRLCLTLDGHPVNGSNVIMADCDGSESQKWIIEETTSHYTPDDVFLVKSSVNSGLCLDVERDDESNLHVWECKAMENSRYNQEFDLEYFQESGHLLSKSEACLDWDDSKNVFGEYKNEDGICGGHCCPPGTPGFIFTN